MKFYFSRRNLIGAPPVDDLDGFTAGKPFSNPAGIHRHVPTADDNHRLGQLRPLPGVNLA